jgi:hypothetical protein
MGPDYCFPPNRATDILIGSLGSIYLFNWDRRRGGYESWGFHTLHFRTVDDSPPCVEQ